MLTKANRINTQGDFRRTMNKGKRVNSANLFITIRPTKDEATRFGFVVSKVVGNAVARNLVKRRLREIAAEVIAEFPTGIDAVVRPGATSINASFDELRTEVFAAVRRAVR